MNHESDELSDMERVVIQVVVSLPYLINEVPRPHCLNVFESLSGIGQREFRSVLCKLDLSGVLTENPDQAIQKAMVFLPLPLESSDLPDPSSSFVLE